MNINTYCPSNHFKSIIIHLGTVSNSQHILQVNKTLTHCYPSLPPPKSQQKDRKENVDYFLSFYPVRLTIKWLLFISRGNCYIIVWYDIMLNVIDIYISEIQIHISGQVHASQASNLTFKNRIKVIKSMQISKSTFNF